MVYMYWHAPLYYIRFLDATGQLWAAGGLAGKFAGTFFSTASQHGYVSLFCFNQAILLTYAW